MYRAVSLEIGPSLPLNTGSRLGGSHLSVPKSLLSDCFDPSSPPGQELHYILDILLIHRGFEKGVRLQEGLVTHVVE